MHHDVAEDNRSWNNSIVSIDLLTFTVGIILLGRTKDKNDLNSLKVECSEYGTWWIVADFITFFTYTDDEADARVAEALEDLDEAVEEMGGSWMTWIWWVFEEGLFPAQPVGRNATTSVNSLSLFLGLFK